MMHGAPSKEHRLLEYFLVVSYGEHLKIRERSPLMDIFEHHHYNSCKTIQHHHVQISQSSTMKYTTNMNNTQSAANIKLSSITNKSHIPRSATQDLPQISYVHEQSYSPFYRARIYNSLYFSLATNNLTRDSIDDILSNKPTLSNNNSYSSTDQLQIPLHIISHESQSSSSSSNSNTFLSFNSESETDDEHPITTHKISKSLPKLSTIHSTLSTDNDDPFQSLKFEPIVIDRFPPLDHEDTELISVGAQLQYFCLPTGLFLTNQPSLPIFYTFVWTPATGEHLYGCCLRFFEPVPPQIIHDFCTNSTNTDINKLELDDCQSYYAPKCLCIISYYSFISAYRTFLTELYRISLTPNIIPIERYLCNLFLECPLPPRGYFSTRYFIGDKQFRIARPPLNNPLIECEISHSTRILFELFSIANIMHIFRAILLEQKILFVSTQYSILTKVTETFISLLYPFTWPHVYIPVLPEDFLAFLKAPTVFMIGIHKSMLASIDELDDDILMIDINYGSIQSGYNLHHCNDILHSIPHLPRHEMSKLMKFLAPASKLLYGAHEHDFHQMDLAFAVAPTPDMIEAQEALQRKRFKKMQPMVDECKIDDRPSSRSRFSINFKLKKLTLPTIMGSRSRRSSLENSPVRKRLQLSDNNSFPYQNKHVVKKVHYNSKSDVSSMTSGNLSDITVSPLNTIFDDVAVRNGFLRFWISIFRCYRDFILIGSALEPVVDHYSTGTSLANIAIKEDISDDGRNLSRNASSTYVITKIKRPSFSQSVSSVVDNHAQNDIPLFDDDKFLKSVPNQSKPFLQQFIRTEAFHRYISKSIYQSRDPNVLFFDEKIIQKLGRSRFTKAKATPFLDNRDYKINHEFQVPSPIVDDLHQKTYSYPEWPALDHSLFIQGRKRQPKSRSKSSNHSSSNISSIYTMSHLKSDDLSITEEFSKSNTSTLPSAPVYIPSKNTIIAEENSISTSYKHRPISLRTRKPSIENPFSYERVTYHLWFYIFLRAIQQPMITKDNTTTTNNTISILQSERVLHLMIKILCQMKNENIGIADHWVFLQLVEVMGRMHWGSHILKLVEVMNELQFKIDSNVYSALLKVLNEEFGDLEIAYNMLAHLPQSNITSIPSPMSNDTTDDDNTNGHVQRRNSLLLNCKVKPITRRRKYYETIVELQKRFSTIFPKREICICQECPHCKKAVHDIHLRMGWSDNDIDCQTKCSKCNERFIAQFLIKDKSEYNVMFDKHPIFELYSILGINGVFVKSVSVCSDDEYDISVGDQIIGVNGHDICHLNVQEIEHVISNPQSINKAQTPPVSDDESQKHRRSQSPSAVVFHTPQKKKMFGIDFSKFHSNGSSCEPLLITFRRVITCDYTSPLILYKGIRTRIQTYAYSMQDVDCVDKDESVSISSSTAPEPELMEKKRKSTLYEYKKRDVDILVLMRKYGVCAINNCEFRVQSPNLFWGLCWHFSNLRLPLHFFSSAFDDQSEIYLQPIEKLIRFQPFH